MSLLKEFREFAVRGNVIDLAIGVIIGAAFGKVVSSFVGDVVMPPLGILVGGVNFSDLAVVLKEAVGGKPAVLLAYGKFIQSVFDFVIISFSVMMGVKAINSLKRPAPEAVAAAAEPTAQEKLLMEIRDTLKQQKG